jgi:hypothetical protein
MGTDTASLDNQLAAYTRRTRRQGRHSATELLGYTAAAGGLAFAGGDAMADIIHFNTQLSVSWSSTTATAHSTRVPWDINGDGIANGRLLAGGKDATYKTVFGGLQGLVGFAGTGSVLFAMSSAPFLTGFAASSSVSAGAGAGFSGGGILGGSVISTKATFAFGNFVNTTGYVGMAFKDASNPNGFFGWAKVRTDLDVNAGTARTTVFEWAYDDTGAPIHVPDRSAAVPAPPTAMLALLGLGVMGIRGYRQRREQGLQRLAGQQAAA